VERYRGDGVLVSLRGGQVVPGGAPLDLVASKVDEVRALVYRTAEFLAGLPHRVRGVPSPDIQKSCRPWLFQAAPGSYQFAVTVQEPVQGSLFQVNTLDPGAITATLLHLVRASIEDPEESLVEVVPNTDYRSTFLKLTRNLAPPGESFKELRSRRVSFPESRPIVLVASCRAEITKVLRKISGPPLGGSRAGRTARYSPGLHLDDDWLQVDVDSEQAIHIDGVKEVVDDVIGPIVNRAVVLEATKTRRGKYRFRDIQLAE